MPLTTGQQTKIANFIGGQHMAPLSQNYFENINPATGQVIGLVPDSDERDLEIALQNAKNAFSTWKDSTKGQRIQALSKLAGLIQERAQDFAEAECADSGKSLWACQTIDVPRAIDNLQVFARALPSFGGQNFENSTSTSYTLRQPLGVVATISPWNLPLLLLTWKVAPALAAGNCVIAKPSEVTPLTAYLLSQLVNEAGFPPGVFNILHGRGPKIGRAMTNHPLISAISFTGGTKTGMEIYEAAARTFKKVSLELGGKNPSLVFADAPWEKTLEGIVFSAFANQGQVCLCGSRILVHTAIYERFKAALIEKTKSIAIGDPLNEQTRFGSLASKDHMEKVLGYIELARQEGGKILVGGQRKILEGRCQNGFFVEPTLIEGLRHTCRTNQEEIFGPVATLIPFESEDQAIEIANSTSYGLSASVWTADEEQGRRVAARLDAGVLWINCWNLRNLDAPFGGMKKSGMGREGTLRGLEFFSEEKTVTVPRL